MDQKRELVLKKLLDRLAQEYSALSVHEDETKAVKTILRYKRKRMFKN